MTAFLIPMYDDENATGTLRGHLFGFKTCNKPVRLLKE
jgi:hypothetical protein